MKKLLLGIAALAATAASVSAAVTTYECRFGSSADGFISKLAYVSVDATARRAAVLDGFAYRYNNERPVPAKFKQLNNGRYRVVWAVDDVPTSASNAIRITSTLRLDPKSLDAYVTANLSGAAVNTPRARGKCAVVQGRSLLG
ncbi:MAG: hypothetical protein AAGK82_10545 [Pseudomonadota bacterium]